MHKRINILASRVSVLVLCSCARAMDKTLSPPSDTQWVNVKVQNPSPYTKPFPLEVRYISHKCLKKESAVLMVLSLPNLAITSLKSRCSREIMISGRQRLR